MVPSVIIFPFLFLPAPFKILLLMMGFLSFSRAVDVEHVEPKKVERLEEKAEVQPK